MKKEVKVIVEEPVSNKTEINQTPIAPFQEKPVAIDVKKEEVAVGLEPEEAQDDQEISNNEEQVANQNEEIENRERFSSDFIDYPVSEYSHKESFHAHSIEHNNKSSTFKESPMKETISEPEEILYSNVIKTSDVEQQLVQVEELDNKLDEVVREIELFQIQFGDNLSIEEFTQIYLNTLRPLGSQIKEVKAEFKEILNLVENTKTGVTEQDVSCILLHLY